MRTHDELMPRYEFSERHRLRVDVPAERVDRAVRELTLADVPLVRALFALRGLPRRGRVLEIVTGLGRVLDDVLGEAIVVGLRGQFWRVRGGHDGGAKFRRYWLVVRPFGGLIRIFLLRAAKRRAESGR